MGNKEFDEKFRELLDAMVEDMAGNSKVDLEKFYGMVYFLENLSYFSPLFYEMIYPRKDV